jgi:formylmethanofuran dehydrogenase subunit E
MVNVICYTCGEWIEVEPKVADNNESKCPICQGYLFPEKEEDTQ